MNPCIESRSSWCIDQVSDALSIVLDSNDNLGDFGGSKEKKLDLIRTSNRRCTTKL